MYDDDSPTGRVGRIHRAITVEHDLHPVAQSVYITLQGMWQGLEAGAPLEIPYGWLFEYSPRTPRESIVLALAELLAAKLIVQLEDPTRYAPSPTRPDLIWQRSG